jgi:hypothetical protein
LHGDDKVEHIYAERRLERVNGSAGIFFLIPFKARVGEADMRVERMIVAVVVAVLAMFAAQGTAVAGDDDPGMTHNSVEMTHN